MLYLSDAEFRACVQAAVASLPEEFRPYLRNISFLIEPWPTRQLVAEAGLHLAPGTTLLGLYVGVPLTARVHGAPPLLPDRIYIFMQPLCEVCADAEALQRQIAITVVHEIAHHFGFDEDELRRLGYG
ncbi:MAG: metallopeptidase family protein [Planctomycetota bacterium]